MSLHSGAPERPRIIEEEDRPGPPPLMSEEKTKGRGLTVLAATLAVAAFAGIVWYAYDQGRRIGSETAAPLIQADTTPTKVRPESPGGMEVPHQDKLVLDDLGSGRGAQTGGSRVERLLPPPETPLPPPEPLSTPATETAGTARPATPEPAPAPDVASAPPTSTATAVIPPAKKPVAASPNTAAPKTATPNVLVPPPPAVPPAKAAESTAAPAPKPVVAQAPPKPAPAPVPVASGGFNIQIAALRSEDAAAKEWNRVKAANTSLLGALGPTYQRVTTSNGVFFRVQGGPLSENAARDICTALKAKGQACLVVKR